MLLVSDEPNHWGTKDQHPHPNILATVLELWRVLHLLEIVAILGRHFLLPSHRCEQGGMRE
jgi:hypothetical protein